MFDIALRARALDGTLLIELEDEANGYWVRDGGMPAEDTNRIRRESRSPWVDGATLTGSTKDQTEVSVLVKVFGSTWAQVEQRLAALRAALDGDAWLLEQVIEGVTKVWRAGPVDFTVPPPAAMDIANRRRFVVLSFPVQPTPTVTGV